MLLRIAVELAATGAEVIFWFQGLSEGKSCWPRRLGRQRSSNPSSDEATRRRRGRRGRPVWVVLSQRCGRTVTRMIIDLPGCEARKGGGPTGRRSVRVGRGGA